jgi:pimeloyl-ACP methyl ester carboxylesterase
MKWAIEHGMVVRRHAEGSRPGPRVVWLHGLGESSVSFEPVIAKLPGYTHVLVDLPGYGRSPWPEAATGLPALADHLARWLDEDPPAIVIGHSMGGVLATLIAERTAVRAIVNIDGNLSRGDCTFSAQAEAYSLAEFCAGGFDAMRAKVYADGAARPELRGYHAAMCFASPAVFHRHACDLVELSSGGTLAPRLAALHVPKLFVAGVPDGICAESRSLLDRNAVRWIGIDPAGHWVYLDQLDRFAAEVSRFLTAV